MSAPTFPEAMPQALLINPLRLLSLWASNSSAEADLEAIFGPRLNWPSAFKHLDAFRRADFSLLPPVRTLPATDMPGLWGGYSRDTREIYISADCPQALLPSVLVEEIGHFLDQELCSEETPGEEGARFAAAVLGLPLDTASQDDALAPLFLQGRELLVEAARKSRGSSKSGKSGRKLRGSSKSGGSQKNGGSGYAEIGSQSSNPKLQENIIYATQDSARILQKTAGDRLIGSRGNDTFVVMSQDVRIEDPNDGTDTVESSVTFSLASHSTIEKLVLTGGANINGTGNFRANVITGNAGNNALEGGGGADTLQGGSGNDTYYIDSASELVIEGAGGGTDTIITSDRSITLLTYANIENIIYTGAPGGVGGGGELISTLGTDNDDYLFGGSGSDTIIGKAGDDTLEGKAGNDLLDGGEGSDTMSGGIGNDTYVVDAATDVIQENSNEGTDLVISSVSFTLGANVENLTLNASLAVADANINGTGNASANSITGNAGNNQLDGGGAADTLTAGAGNDILNGGTADGVGDLLQGGEGNDRYFVDSTLDIIRDSGGTDTVETTVSFDIGDTLSVEGIEHLLYKDNNAAATLKGNNADNSLTSKGTSADRLEAGAGNDTLDGGTGANTLIGGTGDDYYIVNSAAETVTEGTETGSGLDTVLTKVATFALGADSNVEILTYNPLGTSKTTLTGSNSDNTITGGNFGNSLSGLGGNDYLVGGVQNDTLVGGDGNDTLDGKAGVNSLAGGAGDDYYTTDSQSVNLVENLNEGKDTVRSTVNFSLEYSGKLANVEGLYLTGSASLAGTGNSLDNTITGNDGNNALSGKLGNDTILGGLGADYIKGDEGNDSIVGGGDIQGDVPADASTPILLASGQTYTGQINSRNETDWIRVDLKVGVTYTFVIDSQLVGGEVLKDRSDVAFGAQGSDQYWPTWQDGNFGYQPPLIGDKDNQTLFAPWSGVLTDHDELVLNADGTVAYGYFDPKKIIKSAKFINNIAGFQFTPFESGTFYVPVSSAGPALGGYRFTLTDPESPATGAPALADNASNTLLGGAGADTVVAGNGRDAQGKAIGDILLGGTNGLVGQVDTDLSSDTLIGGDGNDSLDGGNGANSLVGGKGDDYYYIRSQSDIVVEQTDGGTGDAMIVNFAAKFTGEWDIVLDPDYEEPSAKPVFKFANIENVTLTGSAHTSVLGSPNSDKIVGNFGNNTFAGGVGDDTLQGEGGNDSLVGGEGADSLDGGSGINTMDGGLGSDTYIVNDRADRIINEKEGLDGGIDVVRTYFNFDPIQGDGVNQFDPAVADNSPSVNKAKSFASEDLESFYNLEHFELLGGAVYGVGNALANSITAGPASSVLYGMGGDDTLLGNAGDDTLYGDTPDFYASPDLYAAAPKDTQTQAFLDGVIGSGGSDYLDGGAGDNYLDAGRGFDTMVGGAGNDTFVQDNVDDYIVAGGGANELITSVNINQAPDGISKLMLVVAKQAADSGQDEVASFASFLGTKNGNNRLVAIEAGTVSLSLANANTLELMYAPRAGEVFAKENGATPNGSSELVVGDQEDDLSNPGKFQYDLSWTVGTTPGQIERSYQDVVGYVVKYKRTDIAGDIWHTYVNGKSQDFQGTHGGSFDPLQPTLKVTNLEDGTYDFQVTALERTIPALQDGSAAKHVTLQGGAGNDAVLGLRLTRVLPGGLADDAYTDPLIQNNPNFSTPLGFIFNPAPYDPIVGLPNRFATYLDGGFGNDILNGDFVNDRSGDDYTLYGGPDKNTLVTFKGLNTLVGGQGSDTFVVKNGGNAIGDEFDWVIKYGNETPVVTQAGNVGSSLNGGQHNLVVSRVDFLTLSDELVNQGKFIDQLALAEAGQFGQGNRLDNYIYDSAPTGLNTLVGDKGRDSIVGNGGGNFLIGGTAYGLDQVGLAVKDFASVVDGGSGLKNSIFRDTDPIPVSPSGLGTTDPSQFWFVPGYYGGVYDPNRNRDTLVANSPSKLDGGAGNDSLLGSEKTETSSGSDMFYVSAGWGGADSHKIIAGDAVFGNTGNDTITFTDSDYLWWSGHLEGAVLLENSYSIERGNADGASDISNLILQDGAASARKAIGNDDSTGNIANSESEKGSNWIVGNEFDNTLDGGGVGGFLRLGVGIDTLKGGSGKDVFLVNGYTGSDANKWSPSYEYNEEKNITKWIKKDSIYADGDYVKILDFEAGDNLVLSGLASNYWIGAPAAILPTNKIPSNITPLDYLVKPSSTYFGIYTAGTPNLVAVVSLVGGLSLDMLTLQEAFTPINGNTISGDVDAAEAAKLGWGTFWKLDGSSFAQYVNAAYVSNPSIASLTTLVRSGDDTFIGGALADFYNGYGGNDSLLGGANNDTLLGGSGNDSLFGQAGNDSLLGQDGADYIDGGAGTDQMIGGTGDDTFVVDTLTDAVTERFNEGADLVLASVSGYALTANVENLTLTGTAINGTGNALDNRLTGNSLDNTLTGLAGKDTLDGGAGTDTLQGGVDDDTYIVDNTNDTIEENADSLVGGTDTVRTSASFDLSVAKVAGGTGIEHLLYTGTTTGVSLTGNINANSITGAAGSDTLDGKDGLNTLVGGSGDDFYVLAVNDDDRIVDTAGIDTVLATGTLSLATLSGGSSIENIQLTAGAGTLTGNSLANTITGFTGMDYLVGGTAHDSLSGGGGNDTLVGSSSSARGAREVDTLTGNAGIDIFVLGDSSFVYYDADGKNDYAIITDFNKGTDLLQLNGVSGDYAFGSLTGGYYDLTYTDELIAKVKGSALVTADLPTIANFV